jgi:hypothetical protein
MFLTTSNTLTAQKRISPILIIQDASDEFSIEVTNEIKEALKYPEFEYKVVDLSENKSVPIQIGTKLIINTTTNIAAIDEEELLKIVEYIGAGGNFIFFGTVTDERFAYLQSIRPGADYAIENAVRGIRGIENIFPGYKGLQFFSKLSIPHDRLNISSFTTASRILATAVTDEQYPIVFENQIGLGKVLVFNSYVLYEKDYRGLMFSAILKMMPHVPYRVANVSTIFLDDFPAPLYNTKIEPIASEYDVEQADFVANIWWPDMKKLADSLLITYSAMTAFNYNANIVPPFDYNEWTSAVIKKGNKDVQGSIFLAKDILKTRHELAFHGYNHFSLVSEEWNSNRSFMESALSSVIKRWRVDDLGKLPITYVPPTNFIDSLGIEAITTALPSIEIMSSLYLGEKEFGGARGFGPDPYSKKLFNYPRISSGFNMDGNSIFNQHSMQLLTGIWNHFVHPDDVFQIVQRDVDAFESRNPDNLGWKTSADTTTSLYQEFVKRLDYTREQYPFIRFLSAKEGVKVTKDWLATSSSYSENNRNYIVNVSSPEKYVSNITNKEEKYWFMYVPSEEKITIERHLSNAGIGFSFSKLWDGFLFQFYSTSEKIVIPKPLSTQSSVSEIANNIKLARDRNINYLTNPYFEVLGATEIKVDIPTERLLADAMRSYRRNPNNRKVQEDIIRLSIDNDEADKAIDILEYRLKSDSTWNENDIDRLVTYYGYESAYEDAENYLEEVWLKFGDEKVFAAKDKIVESLGIFSVEFLTKWRLRELEYYGASPERTLAYTSAIENQETWPEVKQRLLNLISENPRTDSLYAYTIQRSFYYESSDSTIAMLESFPEWSHDQLKPFAEQFANIYGYQLFEYDKALYWADRAENIRRRTKLEWISQNNDLDLFYEKIKEFLNESPHDDSLRVYAGTSLYYLGFRDRGQEIMYPLFAEGKSQDTQAHSLIAEEFKYMSYKDKKDLFVIYPNFFSPEEREKLYTDLRWNEGLRVSAFGEYFTDNFDNRSARGGVSVQFGNRRRESHLFKLEDIYVNSVETGQNFSSNFVGLGYEFEKRKEDYSRVLRFGPSLYAGSEGLLGEAFVSYSISYDSTFTALNLSIEPEFTRQSIEQDIYKLKGEFYREDPWFENNFLTTLSGNTQLYTNSVVDYSLTGRAYLQPWSTAFRGRLIGELGWQDASEDFANADPFFTQNKYFLQGLGFDLRYRDPNSFDYNSLVDFELMTKHAITDGFFIAGRANLEHKFKNFWQIRLGTEFSTSSVYRSNRIFFTISHFFPKKIK